MAKYSASFLFFTLLQLKYSAFPFLATVRVIRALSRSRYAATSSERDRKTVGSSGEPQKWSGWFCAKPAESVTSGSAL